MTGRRPATAAAALLSGAVLLSFSLASCGRSGEGGAGGGGGPGEENPAAYRRRP
ncbi:hypothetical protein ACWC4E_22190 [Streptomyces sp. NPDC001273]|uniref:hypothetical protein n=1 Tax=unclassified Streptomyces TaxID=2593676 RepID=UPI0033C8C271